VEISCIYPACKKSNDIIKEKTFGSNDNFRKNVGSTDNFSRGHIGVKTIVHNMGFFMGVKRNFTKEPGPFTENFLKAQHWRIFDGFNTFAVSTNRIC
jgi:hypothetical protein